MNFKLLREKLKGYYRRLPSQLTSTQIEASLRLAHQLAQQGEAKQAAEKYRQAAESLITWGRFADAERVYHQWSALLPRSPQPYIGLGKVLTLQGKRKKAIAAFKDAVHQKNRKLYAKVDFNWNQTQPQGPNFFINGFARCGTTSLFLYLLKHPAILPCAQKEPMFFNKDYALGVDWYLSQFPVLPADGYLTGEASTRYIDHHQAAQRLYRHFPDAKFVVMMRNPVERTISDYHLLTKLGVLKQPLTRLVQRLEKLQNKSEADLAHWVRRWRLVNDPIATSLYIYHIEHWLSLFSREQFLWLKSEEFYRHPAQTLARVFHFLGLEDYPLAEYPKYNAGGNAAIAPDLRAALASFFAPHNHKLEDKLGITFDWNE